MHHKVLVGLNNTASSWQALETALEYAAKFRADTVGLLVESPFWSPPPIGAAAFESTVERNARSIAIQYGVPFEFRVRHGYPAHTIVEQARVLGCDLVLLGHTDSTVLRRWLTGSLSDLIRHDAPCRVVVAGTGQVLDLDEAPPVTARAGASPI
jgi:nucleotide-binding universal stress UspA family protein